MGKRLTVTVEMKKRAFEMFAQGESVNAVANAVLRGSWAMASRLKREHDGAAVTDGQDEAQAQDGEAVDWSIEVTVPSSALDAVFQSFTDQEKATAIRSVIQSRVNDLQGITGA